MFKIKNEKKELQNFTVPCSSTELSLFYLVLRTYIEQTDTVGVALLVLGTHAILVEKTNCTQIRVPLENLSYQQKHNLCSTVHGL